MPRSPSAANSTTLVEVSCAKVPVGSGPSSINPAPTGANTVQQPQGTSDAHRPAAARPGGRRERVSAPALHQGQTLSPGDPALQSHERPTHHAACHARALCSCSAPLAWPTLYWNPYILDNNARRVVDTASSRKGLVDLLSTDSALLAPYNWTIPAELQVSRCGDSPAILCPKPPPAPLCAAPHRAGRRRCSYTATALLAPHAEPCRSQPAR